MNIQISGRERFLLLTLGMLLILVLGLRFLVLPAYDVWVTRSAQITALQAARQKPAIAESNAAEAARVSSAFFLPKSTPEELHRYFQGFVKTSGLVMKSVSVTESGADVPAGFSKTSVTLSLSGTQAQFIRFLEEIERTDKAIAVESMSLSPAGGQSVGFDVGLTAYCVENSDDDSLDFAPPEPKSADGFRFGRAGDTGGESR